MHLESNKCTFSNTVFFSPLRFCSALVKVRAAEDAVIDMHPLPHDQLPHKRAAQGGAQRPSSVVIERYPDRIVLSNPGTIIPGKKQMLKGGISEPRNKSLFKMFNLIGIGEHAGSGVQDIFEIWKNEGLKEPQVEEQFGSELPDRTTLILPLLEAEGDISKKIRQKVRQKSQMKWEEEQRLS